MPTGGVWTPLLRIESLAWSIDGTALAARDLSGRLRLWSIDTDPPSALVLDSRVDRVGSPTGLAFVAPRDELLRSFDSGRLLTWDLQSGLASSEHALGESGEAAISADGQRVAYSAIADDEHALVVIDASSHTELMRGPGAQSAIETVALSSDGARVLVARRDATLAVFDVASQASILSLDLDQGWRELALSPSGRWLAVAGRDASALRIVDVDTQTVLWDAPDHQATVHLMAISANGERVLTGDRHGHLLVRRTDDGVRLWDWQVPRSSPGVELLGAVLSRDGKRVFSVTSEGRVHAWTVGERAANAEIDVDASSASLTLSPDESHLLVVGDALTRISIADGESEHLVGVSGFDVGVLARASWTAPDLVVLTSRRRVSTYDLDGDELSLRERVDLAPVTDVDEPFVPWRSVGGRWVVAVGGVEDGEGELAADRLVMWDAESGTLVDVADARPADVRAAHVCPTRDTLLAYGGVDGEIVLHDLDTNRVLMRFAGGHLGSIDALRFGLGCETLLSSGSDGQLVVWDVTRYARP